MNTPAQATRMEHDSLGDIAVPANALYGAQTQRAIDNFPIGGGPMPAAFVRALLQIKQAAAKVNARLGELDADIAAAIDQACATLLASDFMPHFPVDVYQTGSGTSSNMNANEVIARLATGQLGRPVDANDHVNRGQSSNDVIPSAVHASAAIAIAEQLLPAIAHLSSTIRTKADAVHHHIKTGRTHLMDAMPVRLSQPLQGWAAQLDAQAERLRVSQHELCQLALGGTAVGTSVNAHPEFAQAVANELAASSGLPFVRGHNFFALMGSQDTAVAASGQLKALAVTLMKISNDLRWMNSGPLAGLSEIALPALQPGSSIMPGKVNPVIPEAVAMVAAQVIGYDTAITVAGQSGNFELNVMLPLVAHNLLRSIELLTNASRQLADRAIAGFTVNDQRLRDALDRNPILVTALNPIIGYAKAAEIAKQAYREGRPIIDVAQEQTTLPREELARLLDPARLAGDEPD